ncbi:MAG TPA: hypothetical protein VFV51_16185 [Vicinamibacterales bacterium]|nr:hypothetical protein [Vicinamibacterales bacterium]
MGFRGCYAWIVLKRVIDKAVEATVAALKAQSNPGGFVVELSW